MKGIFIFVLFVLFGCKKKDNGNVFRVLSYSYQDVWAAVGIQYEKQYWSIYKGEGDTLIFHSNNTVTEKYGTKSITLPVTSCAVDTMQKSTTSPDPTAYYEFKYIAYNKIDTTILGSGSFFATLSAGLVKVTPVYNKTVNIGGSTFTTD